jgi:glucose 1-dehydrogenase
MLLGKKALVTGAARGIGRGCAVELARAGADVAVNDFRRGELLVTAASEIRQLGRRAAAIEGDAFARDSCAMILSKAIEVLGPIDILVSNPSMNRRAPFLDADPQNFEKIVAATLTAGFHMSQLFARHRVAEGGRGKIVFIGSIHARVPYAQSAAYNAAKGGLVSLSSTIANELLPHRVNVNVLEPGWIDTPGERESFGDAAIDAAGPRQPWGRLGRPEDVGKAAAFLASDDADYITGTSLLVDGGMWLGSARE